MQYVAGYFDILNLVEEGGIVVALFLILTMTLLIALFICVHVQATANVLLLYST